MKYNYPQLQGICAKAIKENLCTGCTKLGEPTFIGVEKCEGVDEPVQEEIWIQERIKI